MSIRAFIILVLAGFAAALGLAWFGSSTVRAAECPYPIDTVIDAIESEGGQMLDLVDVAGKGFDQVLLARLGKTNIVFGLVSQGCVVTAPVQIGEAQEMTPA